MRLCYERSHKHRQLTLGTLHQLQQRLFSFQVHGKLRSLLGNKVG